MHDDRAGHETNPRRDDDAGHETNPRRENYPRRESNPMNGATRTDANEPRKVLITGAGGFIGSHLAADQLRRGRHVIAFDLHLDRVRDLAGPTFEVAQGDVGDAGCLRRALSGVDTVFHLAAAHLGARARETEFVRVNVEGVRTIIEVSSEQKVRRFVACSSVGVYGPIRHPPADETSPCHPEIPYEKTKLAGEEVVLDAVRGGGFPAVILRPVWVYGPGCARTEKLFRSIAKGRFLLAGGGATLRHCIYIRDMVDAFDLAARVPGALGEVIVVGDRGAVTVRELVLEIARLTGARAPRSVPLSLLRAAGIAAEAAFLPLRIEPPLSRRTLRFFTGNTSFTIDRARRVLGFEPRYDLRRGLSETHGLLLAGAGTRLPLPEPAAAA